MTGLLCCNSGGKLDIAKTTRLIVIFDTNTSTQNLTKLLESFIEGFVRPVVAKPFYKNVGLRLTILKEFFVIRESSTNLSM